MNRVATGIDVLREGYWRELKGRRLGLLSNQASLDSRLRPTKGVVAECLPGRLKAIFGPQHGYGVEDQDNMIETDHAYDPELDIPVFSLYSHTREPSIEMLEEIDVFIIDLQDVGTRVYTYASTMLNCLRVMAGAGKKVLILDRPNPLGGDMVEGNLLKPELYSFVGPFSLPMRHGLTMGEMARIFDRAFGLDADIEIVPMQGWSRRMLWQDTGLKWIMPSPNMPLPETAQVYPGQVILEATNLSEGRGTCRPFEMFGAPFLDTQSIRKNLDPKAVAGCHLQEITYRPTFHKWEKEICRGFMIHVLDPHVYRPCFTTIALLRSIMEIHGPLFKWKDPPYEYEYEEMPIDLILGDYSLRSELEKGADLAEIQERWLAELEDYLAWRGPYLLYR